MRIDELIRHLEDDHWMTVRQSALFTQLRHAQRPGLVTIGGDPKAEVPAATLRAIYVPATAGRDRAS